LFLFLPKSKMIKRKLYLLLSLFFLLPILARSEILYPQKSIKLIVPFPPGGSTDIFSRVLSEKLTEIWKQPVFIENKPGGNGLIAVDNFLKAPADGHTILIGHVGTFSVVPNLYEKKPYNPLTDFIPISTIAIVPNILVVNPNLPFKNVSDLVQYARLNPGKLTYSSGGNGGPSNLAMEYFKEVAKVDITHIPYKGAMPSIIDLIGGQVSMTLAGAPPLIQHIETGRLRALGIASDKRIDPIPSVPTISESGIPELKGFEVTQWYGVVVKSGTPKDVVKKIAEAIKFTFNSSAIQSKLKAEGSIVQTNSPEEFFALINSELNRWSSVIKNSKIQND